MPLGAPVLPRRLRPREGSRWGPSSGPSAKPFLSGCDLDFSLLSMDSDCGVQAEAVHGACPGLRGLAAGIVWVTLDLPAEQLLPL